MSAAKKETTQNKPSFEDALNDLEQIVADLESGSLGLEESLKRFESGTKLLRECYAILETAERKIELLTGLTEEGEVETEPFDATGTLEKQNSQSAASKPSSRGRKRKSPETTSESVEADSESGSLF